MKIVQVAPYFYPHVGGVESHVHTLSIELVKRGHEVTVITSNFDRKQNSIEEHCGVRIIRLQPVSVLFLTPVVPAVKSAVMNEVCDIVHAHVPPPLCAFFAAKAKGNKKFLLTYHCDPEIPTVFGPLIVNIYNRTLGAETVRLADKIIVTTETYASTSMTIWQKERVVIPSFVDTNHFSPLVSGKNVRAKYGLDDKKVVLFVGRLVPSKGLEYLVESAKYVSENCVFLLVGEGPLRPKLEARARALGISKRLIFAGKIQQSELPEYYAACDVFVLPSISRLEAFGVATVEAMASGKAVLVTDIPGVREVITDGIEGYVVNPMNPKELAEKLNNMLADEVLRTEMGRRGRLKVEREYSVNAVVGRIEKLYRDVSTCS